MFHLLAGRMGELSDIWDNTYGNQGRLEITDSILPMTIAEVFSIFDRMHNLRTERSNHLTYIIAA